MPNGSSGPMMITPYGLSCPLRIARRMRRMFRW